MLDQTRWASMNFEERQRMWAGEPREFRQHHGRGDRPNVWQIWVEGDRVFTRYGLLGGQMQQTDYQGKTKNKGKKNEILPFQDAIAEARRDCRKKWDFEGYDEYLQDRNVDCRNENLSVQHLLAALPGSFCLYKPENELEDQKKLFELAKSGKALWTVKRDGVAFYVVKDYRGVIQLYSRRSRPWSDTEEPTELPDGTLDYTTVKLWAARFPHIVEEAYKLELPNGSMMAGELVMTNPKTGADDFRLASGLTKGLTERSLEDQKKLGMPFFYWWDLPFYEGEDCVRTVPVGQRYELISRLYQQGQRHALRHILPIEIADFKGYEIMHDEAEKRGLEGYVVVDPNAVYGDKGYSLKGKPDRPSTCAKSKPTKEDDFIAYWDPDKKLMGEWGTGKHEKGKLVQLPNGESLIHGGVGSVALYQLNSKGELVYISKCSSGMDYELQARLRKEHFPFVAKCEYKGRTYISEGEKTNSLRHPVFVEKRTDKTIDECINDNL